MEEKTIVAISTPIGVGGISIVRLSGDDATLIADRCFKAKNCNSVKDFEPRKMYLGQFNMGDVVEQCLAVYFKAPHSYTGEDLVEIQCHGGMLITRKILETLINSGATMAEAGEFTKRAFLNGKMSLDEAQGVIDIINAESDSELRAGYNLLDGNLHHEVVDIQSKILDALSKIEVNLDYPEEDLEIETRQDISKVLAVTRQRIEKLISTADTGRKIKEGTKVAIVGKPNVGKSSIMNAMLEYDRAIVTNIQGTTRDVIEETYIYGGVKFVLIDTAGIRDTEDVIESIGVEKSKNIIKNSDVVLYVVDGSVALDKYDESIIPTLHDKSTILIVNKCDLPTVIDVEKMPFSSRIFISALEKNGIKELKQKIFDFVIDKGVLSADVIITNIKHLEYLKNALNAVYESERAVLDNIGMDMVAVNIKNIWLNLGGITGDTDNEKVIENIFEKFCVGK